MSDLDASTPRVFLARHGETEWTKSGRYTGLTDISLTPEGIRQVTATGTRLVGPGKLIDPARVVRIFISPRTRTRQTFDHLFSGCRARPDDDENDKVVLTEDIREWDYGDYEGLTASEIRAGRKVRGLDTDDGWSIWRDGCEGGESPPQVAERLDRLISQIRDIQRPHVDGSKPVDVILVAHGLILRVFVKRWLGFAVDAPLPMMMSPGAIGVLSYKNHDIDEPAFFLDPLVCTVKDDAA